MVVLGVKTDYSLLKSMIKIRDLVRKAKDNNITSLGITDDNMYGAIEFYVQCKKENIKPIIGLEIDVESKIVLYAKNYNGYKNLIKLATMKTERDLSFDDLANYSDDLICILPYEGKKNYSVLNKIYEDFFVSYKNDDEKCKISLDNKIYMREVLCFEESDEVYLKYLKAIKYGKSYLEVIDVKGKCLFPLNDDLTNLKKIEDMCDIDIKMHSDLLPIYKNGDSYKYLKEECIKGMKRIFGLSAPKGYALRLKEELNIINKMGFCDYFLIVADYVRFAKEKGILVGPGRGSAAGSLVSYVLNITTIDPLKYGLLFERFLNPERVTMPDIDIDFEDDRRGEVINYCAEKYGIKRVALISAFGSLTSKQAIRDVSRVMGADLKKVDALSKMLDSRKNLRANLTDRVKRYLNQDSQMKMVYKVALKIEGVKRHMSTHAAGIVMSRFDLDDVLPLVKSERLYISQFDKEYLEDLGLLKMDFLGIKNLTMINNILKEAHIKFDEIPENDKRALGIFKNGDTNGIFQFESAGMINFLKKFKPDSFNDLVDALALFRPGPMKNIDSYIKRKRGLEKVDFLHDDLKSILAPTYGIIVYQEQIMQIAFTLSGFTFGEADILRRAMSKKKEDALISQRSKFINGAVKKGYDESLAIKVYDLILRFAEYGFNKSHSVAYAMISYKMAYLKAYYPSIFMKNLLNLYVGSGEKTKECIYECQKNGIVVGLPNINISEKYYKVTNGKIIYPLSFIKNVGMNVADKILKARGTSKFKDIFDFVKRCGNEIVTDKVMRCLIYSGAFDSFGLNRHSLISNLDVIINYSDLCLLDENALIPDIELQKEYFQEELLKKELDVLGFYLSANPVTEYKRKYNSIDIKDIPKYFDKSVDIVIQVSRTRLIDTKKGDKMMFVTGIDEFDKIDIVLFPKVFSSFDIVKDGFIVKIRGKVEKRFDKFQIIANNVIILKGE